MVSGSAVPAVSHLYFHRHPVGAEGSVPSVTYCIQPGKEVPPLDNPTKIREFQQLGDAAVDMGNRSYKAYEEQKQFIENASHELQTPLAIVRGKVELLAESEGMTEQQMEQLDEIYATLGRAVKLNKSLLLLSRIENGQYTEMEDVSVDEILDELLPDLMDIYEHKQVRLIRKREGSLLLSVATIRWRKYWFPIW